ncbi:MAG: transcription elongation factor subunit Spt4 [Promethearchaeota archaeon]
MSKNKERACKTCHLITRKNFCPKCKTNTTLSDDYSGVVIILDPKNSQVAKKLNITVAGKYALRVR